MAISERRPVRLGLLVVCLAGGAAAAGCGPGYPETAEVHGEVTYAGKPVPEGRILFWPAEGRPAMADLAADGSYSLTTFFSRDGALPGEHRVTIKATRVHFGGAGPGAPAAPGPEAPPQGAGTPVVEWLVPPVYERPETSPLRATVKPGENVIDFHLTADGTAPSR